MTASDKPGANGLLAWLILLTLAALLCSMAAVGFGLLMNMDTQNEMNPNGDPSIRQDAIGTRSLAWGTVVLFILCLSAGVGGGWMAFQRRRGRLSLGLSLLAAVPMFLAAALFMYFAIVGSTS
jgi:hypothetical protein